MNAPATPRAQRPRAVRREQLSDEVAYLRTDITTGTLRPGTFIRLDETAAALGSASPGAGALRTLRGGGAAPAAPDTWCAADTWRHRGHLLAAGHDR
jgi:hypothetical protein